MNFRAASNEQLALLIHALNAVFVADLEPQRQRMLEQARAALSERGRALKEDAA